MKLSNCWRSTDNRHRGYLATALFLAIPLYRLSGLPVSEKKRRSRAALSAAIKFAGAISKQARPATDPVLSSVYVKGNRTLRVSQTNSELVDLAKETITQIDHTKKQYTVVTFAQLK